MLTHTITKLPTKACDSDQDSLGHAATAAWERLPLCEDSDGMSTDACLRYGAADIDTDIRYRFILSLEWRTPAGGWLIELSLRVVFEAALHTQPKALTLTPTPTLKP